MSLARRLWLRVQEPRVITVYQCVIYVAVTLTGIAALLSPPMSIEGAIGPLLTRMFAVFLLTGGALGAIAVLPGIWWLERAAVIACATGALIYAGVVLSLQVTQTGSRLVQLGVIVWALLSIAQRWHRIRRYAYDPER